MGKVYCNGEFVSGDQAMVPVTDHGFLYGDGVFEGIRSYKGRVFKLREHLKRLYQSAKSIHLDIGVSFEEMHEIVLETYRKNNMPDGYCRLVVSRGKGDLGLSPSNCLESSIFCIVDAISLFPENMYQQGLEVKTVSTRKNSVDSLNPRIKSLNYLNNILAKIEANQAGAMEAIMLNREGYITEGTADNIFIYSGRILKTPPLFAGVLEGITRNAILEIAVKLGMKVKEELFTLHDLYVADECFLTGTAAELISVVKADGRRIGNGVPGEVAKELLAHFRALTESDGSVIF